MAKKQEELPEMVGEGVEVKRIRSINNAADKYVDVRDQRMALTEQEVEARTNLLNLMKEHKLEMYSYDGHVVKIETGKDKVKVQSVDDPEVGFED